MASRTGRQCKTTKEVWSEFEHPSESIGSLASLRTTWQWRGGRGRGVRSFLPSLERHSSSHLVFFFLFFSAISTAAGHPSTSHRRATPLIDLARAFPDPFTTQPIRDSFYCWPQIPPCFKGYLDCAASQRRSCWTCFVLVPDTRGWLARVYTPWNSGNTN